MPIIQGELGDLTPEEVEAREQGVKSVKEKLSEEEPGIQTIVMDIVPERETPRRDEEK